MSVRRSHRLPMLARLSGLWRRPDFLKLWAGQFVSKAGSLVTGFALPLAAILVLHASAAQIAVISAAETVPALTLSLFVGVWVDRVRRRPVLVAADVGRALIVGSIPVTALLGRLRIEQFYLVALGASALSVIFDVAYPAYLLSLLRPGELVEANSKLAASEAISEVAGFGLAGALVQTLTAPIAILVDAGSYVVSAISLVCIRTREAPPLPQRGARQDSASDRARARVWPEWTSGIRRAIGDPVLCPLVEAGAIFTLCGNVLGVVLMLYLVREVHLSPVQLGVLFAIGGVSAFEGSLVADWAMRRWGIGRTVISGLAIYTGGSVLIPLAGGPAWLALCLVALSQLADCAHTLYAIGRSSLLQTVPFHHELGRVHASVHLVEAVATLVGIALGGALGQTLGPRSTLCVAAAGMLLAALRLAYSPLRRLRTLPERPGEADDDVAPTAYTPDEVTSV